MRQHTYIAVIERIRDMIRAGDLEPGGKLPPERKLAETFGVSRASIRQAIQALAERGMVASRQGDGTYLVADLDAPFLGDTIVDAINRQRDLLADILEFRLLLEPRLAALAARRATSEEIDRLKILVCDQQLALNAGKDSIAYDAEFHLRLADSSGNRVIAQVMRTIGSILDETRSPWLQSAGRRSDSVDGHLRIIEALAARDPERAAAAMQDHLLAIGHHILGEDRPPPVPEANRPEAGNNEPTHPPPERRTPC